MQNKKRIIAFIMIITLFWSLIPNNVVQAADNINIVSTTTVTVRDAKAWAKSRGATDEFINLADLYWAYYPKNGNVNPAIAYVQAAKETGYGKFTGVVDASYHNPCGLKTTAGGGDYDANAHQRFENWDQGVQAHLDHLALYAGVSGYPRENSYDPRAFKSIAGTAKTVIELGKKWAPSSSYGTDIMTLYNSLVSFAGANEVLGNIDEPVSNQNVSSNTVTVRGWALSTSGIEKVKVYVNNNYKGDAQLGLSRPDIQKVYGSSFSNALTSGFKLDVNVADLSSGNNTVKVEAIGKDGSKLTQTKNINITKLVSLGRIDEPDGTITGTSMTVRGWAIASSGIKEVKIYVNGKLQKTVKPNKLRPDIKNAFPGYPGTETSGYEEKVDISNVAAGNVAIKVEEVANDGSVNTSQRTVNLKKAQALGRIDEPDGTITGTSMTVRGWAIAPSGIKEVKIYVNGKLQKTVKPNKLRTDIKNAFPGYPGTETSGYEEKINIDDIARGKAEIKTEEISNDGSKIIHTKTVNISRKSPIGCIDSPTNLQLIKSDTVDIRGWVSNDSKLTKVNVYLDNLYKSTAQIGLSRPDVQLAYPSYRETKNSGYVAKLDLSGLAYGKHTIKIEAISIDGTISSFTRDIEYKTINKLVVIDPGHNYGGDDGAYSQFDGITYSERDLNMAIALKTKTELEAKGYSVALTRSPLDYSRVPVAESLAFRAKMANDLNADVFVSIHQNSFTSESAKGTEVFYTTNSQDAGYPSHSGDKLQKSRSLAKNIVNGISSSTGFYNRGDKSQSLYVLRNTKMPSVLVECGFISNRNEAKSLSTDSVQLKIAKAIANGVSQVF